MDLPPSGWYPDPYGTPSLLRWWDGSTWTHHTHPDVTSGNGMAANGAEAAVQATAVQAAVAQPVAATAVQAAVASTSIQAAVASTTVQAAVHATTVGPSTEWLRTTKPPTGRPTAPQPALPATPYHLAMQPTTVQPGYPQPVLGAMGGAAGGDGAGTQVMFGGGGGEQPWQLPGMGGPGLPGGPGQGNPYGYLQAQRRRRLLVFGGVTAGAVAAIAMIAIVMSQLGSHAASTTADQAPATTPPPPSPAASHSAVASASASPTASATPAGSLLSDGQSGLSYTQLTAPWQGASCPSSLNNGAFTWTAGEYAVAGQVNGGSEAWYGEACSGPLPQQYGYTGTAQLETTAVNLEQTFQNAYYGDLNHTVTQENSQPVSVSGHVGWEVTYDIVYNDQTQGQTWADEQAAVVVVDNGTAQPAVFFTSIPANLVQGNVQTLVSSLALSTSAASSPADGGATATDGSGNGGQGN